MPKNKCRFSYLKTAKNGTYLHWQPFFLFRVYPLKTEKVTLKVTLLIKVVTLNSNRNSNPKLKITTRKGIKKGEP